MAPSRPIGCTPDIASLAIVPKNEKKEMEVPGGVTYAFLSTEKFKELLAGYIHEILSLKRRVEALEEESASLKELVHEQDTRSKKLKERISVLEQGQAQYCMQAEELAGIVSELQQSLSSANQLNQANAQKIERLTQNLEASEEALKKSVGELKMAKQEHRKKVDLLESKIRLLTWAFQEKQREISALSKLSAAQSKQIGETKKDAQEKMAAQLLQMDELKKELNQALQEKKEAVDTFSTLKRLTAEQRKELKIEIRKQKKEFINFQFEQGLEQKIQEWTFKWRLAERVSLYTAGFLGTASATSTYGVGLLLGEVVKYRISNVFNSIIGKLKAQLRSDYQAFMAFDPKFPEEGDISKLVCNMLYLVHQLECYVTRDENSLRGAALDPEYGPQYFHPGIDELTIEHVWRFLMLRMEGRALKIPPAPLARQRAENQPCAQP